MSSGYKWSEFQRLSGDEQAAVVVAYECKVRIDAIITYEQMKRAIRNGRRTT